MIKIDELLSYVIPFQVYLNYVIKYHNGECGKSNFILLDYRSFSKRIYKVVLRGMLHEINGYKYQEFLFVDDAETKKCKIKKLEKELSKLKGDN